MRAKMNIFCVVLSIICVFLAAKCEEAYRTDEDNADKPFSTSVPLPENTFNLTVPDDETSTVTPFNVSSLLRSNDTSDDTYTDQPNNKSSENVSPAENKNQPPQNIEQNSTNTETSNEGNIDTELKDLQTPDSQEKEVLIIEQHQHPFEPIEPIQISDKIDTETELIENGENTEDQLRSHSDENVGEASLGPLAIILVSAFVLFAIAFYVALLLWRKYLENRYGSRTLLVDEDFADPSDMKHFSI